MLRVNAEYANRIASVFDNAIIQLRNDKMAAEKENCALRAATKLEHLKDQVKDILSYTFEQEQELRSDARRYECETTTKLEELAKLQNRLKNAREERKERREELDTELLELRRVLEDEINTLKKEQEVEIENDLEKEKSDRQHYVEELTALQKQRDELFKQLKEQKEANLYLETKLRSENSSLDLELDQTLSHNEEVATEKNREIDTIQAIVLAQRKKRIELEDHFARVNENNAKKAQEEEALQRVIDIKMKAQALLDNGAIQFQKLFRGAKERALVEKMKKASKKKKGKSKKGGKKK